MHKDIIKTKGKDAQEDMITEERTTILQKTYASNTLKLSRKE